jgi:hypothetical protein
VVRAPDDHGATYLADNSLLDLFERAAADTPSWFRDQVDAMTTPSLPPVDPEAALAGIDASPPTGAGRRRNRGPDASAGTAADESAGGPSGGDATGGDSVRTRSEADAERRRDHPLSDVWGDG